MPKGELSPSAERRAIADFLEACLVVVRAQREEYERRAAERREA
jgi:hypothetical protein